MGSVLSWSSNQALAVAVPVKGVCLFFAKAIFDFVGDFASSCKKCDRKFRSKCPTSKNLVCKDCCDCSGPDH